MPDAFNRLGGAAIAECLREGHKGISEWDFVAGKPLAPWAVELQLWASYRSQASNYKVITY